MRSPLRRKGRARGSAGDYLEPITSKRKRKKFCTYDLESKAGDTSTTPGFTRPFLAGFYDPGQDEYLEFRDEPHLRSRAWETRHIDPGGCVDKLLTIMLTPRYSGHVFYAHNGGKFDALFLLRWLRDHRDEFEMEVVPIQSTIQLIRVWRRPEEPDDPIRESWEFLDSLRLCPMSLAAACDTFGISDEESKIPFDLGTHEDDPRWSIYLERDCRSLARVMERLYGLVEDVLGGEIGITAPSTSMKLFLREFIGHDGVPEKIPRHAHWPDCTGRHSRTCDGCAHDWIRRGYYGGRTEIFRKRGATLRYYDINSSYVASMREMMPIGQRIVDEGKLDWRRHCSEENPTGKYAGFCECEVFIPPECPIPPLPHRAGKMGKLIFPTGTFSGVWSVEELKLLDDPLVGGRITRVKKTVWFRLRPMFQRMVDKLWALRAPVCQACKAVGFDLSQKCSHFDEGLSALAKLLGNSLYGKFAMRQERQTVVFRRQAAGDELAENKRCFLCGEALAGHVDICAKCEGSKPATGDADDDVWYRAKKMDAAYIMPHVSSHITATARVRLWQAMRTALTTRAGELGRVDLAVGLTIREAVPGVEKAWQGWLDLPKIVRLDRTPLGVTISVVGERLVDQEPLPEEHTFDVASNQLLEEDGKLFWRTGLRGLGPGEIIFVNNLGGLPGERPVVVVRVEHKTHLVCVRVRGEGANKSSIVDEIDLPLDALLIRGGRLYYFDTDSCITDVVLPTASVPGALKDEYPGSTLTYEAVQPKVYLIEREQTNADVALRQKILASALAGDDDADASTLDRANSGQGDLYKKAKPVALTPQSKVTMKGFARNLRTKENLERLKRGETIRWQQLEQVRTLARVEFSRPPAMRDVSKSFQTEYGKRVVLTDHPEGFTRAHVLTEPMAEDVAWAAE